MPQSEVVQNQSKVMNLVGQIQAEYEAGQRIIGKLPQDLQDLQEYFVTKRIENMGKCQQELIALVGNAQASHMLAEVGL